METIGKLLGNNKAELEYYVQGFIYKDFEAFKTKTDEICYIPEYGVDDEDNIEGSYTYADFLRMATEWCKEDEDCMDYLKKEGLTFHDVAENLFEMVDWQSPETVLEEWNSSGAFIE